MTAPGPTRRASDPELLGLLGRAFGHAAYRPGQAEIIDSVLAGHPTLAVMPTGAGKSLCYQLPALAFGGTSVVVSPLIALIHDQVRMLKAHGVAAASITSADGDDARRRAIEALKSGALQIAYVAPERFRSSAMMSILRAIEVELFVIDEAHCISEWGHDFRPDYAKLGQVVESLKPKRVVALTATATPEVRGDIVRGLGLEGAVTFVTGFDRPNLELSVEEVSRQTAKLDAAADALRRWMGERGSGIVYVATRDKSDRVAEELAENGFRAMAYHAGLAPEARTRVQRAFEDEASTVVVATTAFGMGVDKRDVRVVVHHEIPRSPESYYQEVGRAGRDGLPAAGVLLYSPSDLRYAYMKLEASCPTPDAVEQAHRWLVDRAGRSGVIDSDFDAIVEVVERSAGVSARAALIALERAGDVSFEPGMAVLRSAVPRVDVAALAGRERQERARLDAMIGYVMRAPCRRRYLVDYFGDDRRPERCGACDRCAAGPAQTLAGRALEDAQKALSCVARMRGRFGKTRVADVLLGSRAQPILDAGLDQLSTHGLLSTWSKAEILQLLDGLMRADLVCISSGEYPKLMLTEKGADALRSRSAIELGVDLPRWRGRGGGSEDGRPSSARGNGARGSGARGNGARGNDTRTGGARGVGREVEEIEDEEPDGPLVLALRAWRGEASRSAGVPAYVIAHNRLLDLIALREPRDAEELRAVPGMGPAKLEKYGEAILEIVRAHADATPAPAFAEVSARAHDR